MALGVVAVMAMAASAARAAPDRVIEMNAVSAAGVGASAGRVVASETRYGVVFAPDLKGLPPGLHGFHVHERPACAVLEKDGKAVAALAAGGHFDPQGTKKHDTPWGDGHLGDLPPLFVDAAGNASQPVLAPRLKLSDLAGRSLMVHAGGDNHSDHPEPLGGGGARIVCGVIE
ncbi:MAG: superoxide dismutase [Cu-Zn] SodC2 [Betaproteobacteria bacterium]|nr:MAG: superoxide dismutase [Cu-Zn] SodC2 [Betaproteobacteria bacterium]